MFFSRRRRLPAAALLTTLVTTLLTALVALAGAPVASAHAELSGADPADGSTVGPAGPAPTRVTLTFSEDVQAPGATVTVVGPGGAHAEQGAVAVDGARVSVAVGPLAPGPWEIGYRIVSDDGHPVTGASTFTVAGPAAGPSSSSSAAAAPAAPSSALPSASPAAASRPTADDGSGSGTTGWVLGGIAVVVVVGAVAFVLRRRA